MALSSTLLACWWIFRCSSICVPTQKITLLMQKITKSLVEDNLIEQSLSGYRIYLSFASCFPSASHEMWNCFSTRGEEHVWELSWNYKELFSNASFPRENNIDTDTDKNNCAKRNTEKGTYKIQATDKPQKWLIIFTFYLLVLTPPFTYKSVRASSSG